MAMIEIPRKERVEAEIALSGSKSITNRALVIGALAEGVTLLHNRLECEDTAVMTDCLRRLGFSITPIGDDLEVRGRSGLIPVKEAGLNTINSGTTMRFLTGLLALGNGTYTLDGNPRMRERPIGPLLQAIRQMGITARSVHENDCPPLTIKSSGLPGGDCELDGGVSSQFLSALLLSAPYAAGETVIRIKGELVSRPYVEMTIRMMNEFGVEVKEESGRIFRVPAGQEYAGRRYTIEGDASTASYFWTAAALTGGSMKITNIGKNSIQGDARFVDVLEKMGAKVGKSENRLEVSGSIGKNIEIDLNEMPDMVPTLATAALFVPGRTVIKNVANLRLKESDRLQAIATEIGKIGGKAEELSDGLIVEGGEEKLHGAEIETYNDHRIAMAFALVGLKIGGIKIKDPDCVAKTCPDFFKLFLKL